jgi:voltage-gated potassium channel
VKRPNLLERRISRFLNEPPTLGGAASVIVTATVIVVGAGGVVIRLVDPKDYPNVWLGMWWALQTVTTVGYGDATPVHRAGRLVAAVVMLQGIAFIAIVTAVITSVFVTRGAREYRARRSAEELDDRELIERRFDELEAKIDRLAAAVEPLTPPG